MIRLLRRSPNGDLELVSFDDDDDPPEYAILSHTWSTGHHVQDREVTYNDLIAGAGKDRTGYRKIEFCVDRAAADELSYCWVDTCCINKGDPTELSTAINSMFRWYQRAAKCYVLLSDVRIPAEVAEPQEFRITWAEAFRRSRWFKRGWTLQELLAPPTVEFFSREGKRLGSRISLEPEIHDITKIPIAVLRGRKLTELSFEERMSWTANRKTKIKEDKVYCLLGIFGVFLPLIYGEGEAYATLRLQDEVQKRRQGKRTASLQEVAERTEASEHGVRSSHAPPIPRNVSEPQQYGLRVHATPASQNTTEVSAPPKSKDRQHDLGQESMAAGFNTSTRNEVVPSKHISPVPIDSLPKGEQIQVVASRTGGPNREPNASPSTSQQQNYESTNHLTSQDFILPRPPSDEVIAQMFLRLMKKRGWYSLPEQAQRQMLAYSPAKKWTLVYQDKLTEWQQAKEGSPVWYAKILFVTSISSKQLQELIIALQTHPVSWIQTFLEARGLVALIKTLQPLNRKHPEGSASGQGSMIEVDLNKENETLWCIKALITTRLGIEEALKHPSMVVVLVDSLLSPRLSTRTLSSGILPLFCHWDGGSHAEVLVAFDRTKKAHGESGRFDRWIRFVEKTIDGRGDRGSLVGATEEYERPWISLQDRLTEYALATLMLVNALINALKRPDDLKRRDLIHAEFTSSGIKRILDKMEKFQDKRLDGQIGSYRMGDL